MQSSPITKHLSNIIIFGSVSPEITRPQIAIFGGSHLSWAVLAILYQVLHSFYRVFWVMRQGLALARAQSFAQRPLVIPYQTLYWTRLVHQWRTKTAQLRCPAQLMCPASYPLWLEGWQFSATKMNFEKPPVGGGVRGWIRNIPESVRLRFHFRPGNRGKGGEVVKEYTISYF